MTEKKSKQGVADPESRMRTLHISPTEDGGLRLEIDGRGVMKFTASGARELITNLLNALQPEEWKWP